MLKTKRVEVPDIIYRDGEKRLEIYRDLDPCDPREWEQVGIMKCSHKRYNLGDEQIDTSNYQSWEEIEKAIIEKEDPLVILPLYLYDHSGITMSTTPFHSRWDSGKVGFIYVTRDCLEGMGVETRDKEELKKFLKQEVETYDNYLTGEVYRFIYHENGEQVDACSGFNGKFPEVLPRIAEELGIEEIEEWEREDNY